MGPSSTAQQSLLLDVEALVAALLGDTLPAQVTAIVDRLEAAADRIPPGTAGEVRTAIRLVRGGQPCAGISALLTARTGLGAPPR